MVVGATSPTRLKPRKPGNDQLNETSTGLDPLDPPAGITYGLYDSRNYPQITHSVPMCALPPPLAPLSILTGRVTTGRPRKPFPPHHLSLQPFVPGTYKPRCSSHEGFSSLFLKSLGENWKWRERERGILANWGRRLETNNAVLCSSEPLLPPPLPVATPPKGFVVAATPAYTLEIHDSPLSSLTKKEEEEEKEERLGFFLLLQG